MPKTKERIWLIITPEYEWKGKKMVDMMEVYGVPNLKKARWIATQLMTKDKNCHWHREVIDKKSTHPFSKLKTLEVKTGEEWKEFLPKEK